MKMLVDPFNVNTLKDIIEEISARRYKRNRAGNLFLELTPSKFEDLKKLNGTYGGLPMNVVDFAPLLCALVADRYKMMAV